MLFLLQISLKIKVLIKFGKKWIVFYLALEVCAGLQRVYKKMSKVVYDSFWHVKKYQYCLKRGMKKCLE